MKVNIENINTSIALGFMGMGRMRPSPEMEQLLEECSQKLLLTVSPCFCYRIFELDKKEDYIEIKGTAVKLCGDDTRNLLADSKKVAIMCCTAGIGADRLIDSYAVTDMAKSTVCDALGGAVCEQVCDYAQDYISEKHGVTLTMRFSPGYGDLPLETQKTLLTVVNAFREAGVSITDSMLMTPKKSVTAIMGIIENDTEINAVRRCDSCMFSENCVYRKGGGSCGFKRAD